MFNPKELERAIGELEATRAQLAVANAAALASAGECARMEQELQSLRHDLAESERAVHFLTQRDFAITREDIAEIEQNGVPLAQVLAELEEMLK